MARLPTREPFFTLSPVEIALSEDLRIVAFPAEISVVSVERLSNLNQTNLFHSVLPVLLLRYT